MSDPSANGASVGPFRPRVLVVDDQASLGEFVRVACCDGYQIELADNGAAAIELLRQSPFDIVISDFRMPGLSGTEVLAQTAQLQPETVRIMMTGYAQTEVMIEAVNQGHIHFFLPKPFESHDVCNVLRRADDYGRVLRERRELIAQLEKMNRELELRVAQRTAELRDISEHRGLALEAGELGTWEHILDTGEVYWDPRRCQMAGVAPGTKLNIQTVLNSIHPEDRHKVRVAHENAIAGNDGGIFSEQYRVVWPDGTIRWIEGHGRTFFAGEGDERRALRFIGVAKDITEAKRVVERMTSLAAVAENSTDLVGFATPEGQTVFINPAGRRMIGLEPDEPIHDTQILDYVMEEERNWFAQEVLSAVMRDGSWQGEVRFRHCRTGVPVPMWQSIFCVSEPGTNRRLAICTISRDMTARKVAEAELLQAKEAAEAADRAKSQFLANMSHEIRTPMNGIMGATELLQQTELDEEQASYLDIARLSGERMLAVINQILDFSRIDARQLVLDQCDFDLRQSVEEVKKLMSLEARKKGLTLTAQVSPDVPPVLLGDAGRILQILSNLVGNAIKFTERGVVAIRLGVQSAQGDTVVLRGSVADSGIGISREQQKNIFSPFVQADGSTTRKYGGTGLGLAICRQLLDLMGGQIGVESEEGKGSTFWFTVTLAKPLQPVVYPSLAEPASLQETVQVFGAPPQRPRVLIAEDNIAGQRIAEAILGKLAYDADVAANGMEAIQALRERNYDAVLMDCEMPGLDGYEATRLIRKPETGVRDPGIPIIALTADALPGDRERCLQAGMSDYLAKPISMQKLSETLAVWTARMPQESAAVTAAVPGEVPVRLPVFDEEGLLRRLMGDRTLAEELITYCVRDLPERLSDLRATVHRGDLQAVRFHAHAIKGAAANVSAHMLRQWATEIQQASSVNDLDRSLELLPQLELEFEQFKAALLISGWTGWQARNGVEGT